MIIGDMIIGVHDHWGRFSMIIKYEDGENDS